MHRNPGIIQAGLAVVAVLSVLSWSAQPAFAEPPGSERPVTMTTAEHSAAQSQPTRGEPAALQAQYMEESSQPTAAKSDYMIISPHTAAECDAALQQAEQLGTLSKFEWGCKQGDHTGYAIVQATSKEEALKMVPENVRAKARVIKVDRLTPEEIKAMHSSKAH